MKRGLWLPIVLCFIFWGVIGHAAVEKVSDTTYKISIDITKDLSQVKGLIKSLEADKVRKQSEIADIDSQVTNLQKEVEDAEAIGVVEGSLTVGGM